MLIKAKNGKDIIPFDMRRDSNKNTNLEDIKLWKDFHPHKALQQFRLQVNGQ